jgi:ribose/xylose/arabinose/galactoside ABC-type transport system permease subunit
MTESTSTPKNLAALAITRETALLGLIVLQLSLFAILFPYSFPTAANFSAIIRNLALDGILALAALALAAFGGFINGVIVARVKVNALIATLGTMGIFRGFAILIGEPGITVLPPSFSAIGQAEWLGLQTPVWVMLAMVARV